MFPEKLRAGTADRLRSFLDSPDRPEGTLSYHELQGFLFAIACSPEMIPPSDWLPLVFAGQEANFSGMDEANAVIQAIMTLYNQLNQQVVDGEPAGPPSCAAAPLDNFSDDAPLGQWARGFLMGHSYLDEVWEAYALDEWDEELGSCMMVLSFFADRTLAGAYQEESVIKERPLEELAQDMLRLFEDAMLSYAHMGRSIYLARMEQEQERREPASSKKIGRNEPCPCGSGKKFKKCCGGPKILH